MGLTANRAPDSRILSGRVLVAGAATGKLLRLSAPISFWGGVDPATGRISDPRHPEHGRDVAGRILALPATMGSSSSSAIMLELLRVGKAPAALLLGKVDAILVLGVIVAREMGYDTIPVLEVSTTELATLPADASLHVGADGNIAIAEQHGGAT